jgi:hypothetical protein
MQIFPYNRKKLIPLQIHTKDRYVVKKGQNLVNVVKECPLTVCGVVKFTPAGFINSFKFIGNRSIAIKLNFFNNDFLSKILE